MFFIHETPLVIPLPIPFTILRPTLETDLVIEFNGCKIAFLIFEIELFTLETEFIIPATSFAIIFIPICFKSKTIFSNNYVNIG